MHMYYTYMEARTHTHVTLSKYHLQIAAGRLEIELWIRGHTKKFTTEEVVYWCQEKHFQVHILSIFTDICTTHHTMQACIMCCKWQYSHWAVSHAPVISVGNVKISSPNWILVIQTEVFIKRNKSACVYNIAYVRIISSQL